jgi:hypothetical protein
MIADSLNRWLSLLANIGVVVGLIVIMFELHESNRQAASIASQARYTEIETSFRDYALSDHLPEIYVIVDEEGVSGLNKAQLERLRSWEMARLLRMEGQYVQFHAGYLSDTAYAIMLKFAQTKTALWNELEIAGDHPEFNNTLGID